jgi:hypothetical protein
VSDDARGEVDFRTERNKRNTDKLDAAVRAAQHAFTEAFANGDAASVRKAQQALKDAKKKRAKYRQVKSLSDRAASIADVETKVRKSPKAPGKCAFCDEPASKALIFKSGQAQMKTCAGHVENGRKAIRKRGMDVEKTFSVVQEKRAFSSTQRQHSADTGAAMPDGSFPIHNVEDLKNAIRDAPRAKDPEAAKKFIIKMARQLGKMDLIPDSWNAK